MFLNSSARLVNAGRRGAAAWGEAVLGDGGMIITQDFDRYPVVRMQSVPVDAHGKVS